MDVPAWFEISTFVGLTVLLLADLALVARRPHEPSVKEATAWVVFRPFGPRGRPPMSVSTPFSQRTPRTTALVPSPSTVAATWPASLIWLANWPEAPSPRIRRIVPVEPSYRKDRVPQHEL